MSQIISQALNLKPLKISGVWLATLFVLSTGGLLIIMIFTMLAYQMLYLNKIYPGVSVAGIEVGGMTLPQAMATINARSTQSLSRPLTIQAGDQTWTITGQELGIRVDVEATANKAYAVGRQGSFLADMLTHLYLLAVPRDLEVVMSYDTGPINQVLQRLAGEINRPPQDAQLIIHPDARVEFIPAQRGRRMHTETTRSLLEAAIFNQDEQPVTAVVQEVIPALTDADVAVARQQAENLLSEPLVFSFSTATDAAEWRLEPQTLVAMIDIVDGVDENGRTQLAVEFNLEKFTPHFEEFAKAINIEPSEARFEFDSETNQLTVLQESRDGRTLNMEAAYQQLVDLQTALQEQPTHLVELPVVLTPPAVSSQDIDRLGIETLVSESVSYFKGSSQGRMHNIALAASKFHGVVVPPGEIFSFNRYLGEVTKENGFDESLIIFGNRTTVGIGGGVCQVSTTAFRTAFFGGFELVERWAHGYRVGWYETNSVPGLDATVYTPEVDLKFRNDTDHHLLIQTETDLEAGTLTFRFYGTPTDREIIVSDPEITRVVKHGPAIYEEDSILPKGTVKQVDWAKDGMDVTVTRTVKAGDVVFHEDVITSHYRPWRAVYQVGTAE